jgi:hypothetical protein
MAEDGTADPVARGVLDRFEKSVRGRRDFDVVYNELKQLVRPDVAWFNIYGPQNTTSDIATSRNRIYDSTATWSADQLTSGLHTYVSSPVEPFFTLGIAGAPRTQLPFQVLQWLDTITSILYAHFCLPEANFHTAIHEVYSDLAVFGTGGMYQWIDQRTNTLRFRSFPLSSLYLLEDSEGCVDTIHRTITYTTRQLKQEWPEAYANSKRLQAMEPDSKVMVIHEVCPRIDRNPESYTAKNKPWASTYVCKETSETLSESGYDQMPYCTPRWTKLPGELYGRGPGVSVLPDIRMCNAMSKAMIVAAQKLADPPLVLEDDSMLLPLRTHPGGINFKRPGSEEVKPLPMGTRVDITDQLLEQRRDAIRRGFFIDWLVRPTKKERQTAQEINDDRQQMLSLLSPSVGRIQSELLGPVIKHSYSVLLTRNLLPPPPGDMGGTKLEIVYTSPAAKAQQLALSQGAISYVQQLSQLLPIMPDLIYSINTDKFNEVLVEVTQTPRNILESPEVAQQKKQAAQQQQQQAQSTETLPAMAGAAKDYAQARQADPSMPPMTSLTGG